MSCVLLGYFRTSIHFKMRTQRLNSWALTPYRRGLQGPRVVAQEARVCVARMRVVQGTGRQKWAEGQG